MSGFKNFILRGNLVDLAVAVVIGAQFSSLVRSCPQCTMSIPIAARRCPQCTADITPATEQPRSVMTQPR